MSEIEYVPGGTKVIKSVCITTDNPRLSPPCPPATHPQMWNPLEYEKNFKRHNRPKAVHCSVSSCHPPTNVKSARIQKNISKGTTEPKKLF